jgi:hypothetical protein
VTFLNGRESDISIWWTHRFHFGRTRQPRKELAAEIEAAHDRLRTMIEDVEKLDSVILQFDPSHQVEAIKPQGVPAAV